MCLLHGAIIFIDLVRSCFEPSWLFFQSLDFILKINLLSQLLKEEVATFCSACCRWAFYWQALPCCIEDGVTSSTSSDVCVVTACGTGCGGGVGLGAVYGIDCVWCVVYSACCMECMRYRGENLMYTLELPLKLLYLACAFVSGAIHMPAMLSFCCTNRTHQTHAVHNRTGVGGLRESRAPVI